jgi:uncharacterized protein YceK
MKDPHLLQILSYVCIIAMFLVLILLSGCCSVVGLISPI